MLAPAEASGLALHPGVKGYCRPDLPAHCRGKKRLCVAADALGLLTKRLVFEPERGFTGGWCRRIFLTDGGLFIAGAGEVF